LVALVDVLVQAPTHHGAQTRRRFWCVALERRRIAIEDERTDLHRTFGDERLLAGDQLSHHDAERPDVSAMIDVTRRADLLGRHV
jgi:hypothetical protein